MKKKNKKKKIKLQSSRDVRFDGLRTIGILAIIFAHVNPPAILFQLRNFDVPLMVLISGAVYGLSTSVNKNYVSYISSRIPRLLVPTWIFLTIYFIFIFIISTFRRHLFPYSLKDIFGSYELLSDMGYLWIIRVFILIALIMPLLKKMYQRFHDKRRYLFMLFGIYSLYEVGYFFYSSVYKVHMSFADFIVNNFLIYVLSYGCVAGLGLYLINAKKKSIISLLIGFLLLFLYLAYSFNPHHFTFTQDFKYPPRIYYFLYALIISLLLYLVSDNSKFKKVSGSKIVQFISSSSIWIYLWHIFVIYIWSTMQKNIFPTLKNFIIEYLFIIFFAIIITYFQKYIVSNIVKHLDNKKTQNLLTLFFLK